jgi:diguanylate cyclase (GGDEF)-like protein/PAS domain S-box-containing protein
MQQAIEPRILIVEDQIVEAINTSNRLKHFNMDVVGVTADLTNILSLIKKESPNLILMDINLGGGQSGIDAAEIITKQHNIPIVFTTSFSDDKTISSALSVSPYGYLIKPYGEVSLKTAVQVALERKKIENELTRSNTRFEMASKVANLGVLEVDAASRSVVIKSVDNLFSFPQTLALDDFLSLFPDEEVEELKYAVDKKTKFHSVLQIDIEGRETQWHQVVLSDVTLAKDTVQIGAIQDISQLQSTQSSLGVADKIVSEIQEGVMVCDESGVLIKVNDAICSLLGKERMALLSAHFDTVFPQLRKGDDRPNYLVDGLRTDVTIVNKFGVRRHLVMSVSSFNASSTQRCFVAIFTDVTDLKSSETQLKYLAFTDALTGAGNRNYLNSVVEKFTDSREPCSIIFIDIDEFKLINDTHGHEVGDEILRGCVSRLKATVREDDNIIRFGGDEFVIVTKATSHDELSKMTERVNAIFSRIFSTTSGAFRVTASIGVASTTEDMTSSDLLKNADIAMYSAKQFGKNNTVIFNESLSKDIEYRLFIQQGLANALAQKQIVACFQPIVSADGNVLAVEALARWYIPGQGCIPPDKFIPIAERTKYIHEIGFLMLDEACLALKTLKKWGVDDIRVNLNMSSIQLQNGSVVEIFNERFLLHEVDPGKIVVEITESTLQSAKARKILSQLKVLGVTVAIDDFGTGFSSIAELAEDTYDAIKIDRSLLPDFPLQTAASERRALIIKNVIAMCGQLDMPCTLEGLETSEQVSFAKMIGVGAMQGYHFAKPMNLVELMEYLQACHATSHMHYRVDNV